MTVDTNPGETLTEGDELQLLIGSSELGVLEAIASDLQRNPELTAGSLVLEARAAKPLETGVGDVGSTGTITTASGVVVASEPPEDSEHDSQQYWSDRRHDTGTFRSWFTDAAERVLEHESTAQPAGELFDSYEFIKTYPVTLDVSIDYTETLIASKWDFEYKVRSEQHREALNTLLRHGVGQRRGYGFGMLQTRSDELKPDADTKATAEAA